MSPQLRDRVDVWRIGQADMPSRSEAIRRLVEQALRAAGTPSGDVATDADKPSLAPRIVEAAKQATAIVRGEEPEQRN